MWDPNVLPYLSSVLLYKLCKKKKPRGQISVFSVCALQSMSSEHNYWQLFANRYSFVQWISNSHHAMNPTFELFVKKLYTVASGFCSSLHTTVAHYKYCFYRKEDLPAMCVTFNFPVSLTWAHNVSHKPWPNGPPNSSQVHNFDGVGYHLAAHLAWVGLSWIELAWIWWSSHFHPTRAKFCTIWPPQLTQANSNQVVLLLLGDHAVVFRQLNGFLWAGSTWRYRLATRRCKFWFCNLAQVGSTVWPGLLQGRENVLFKLGSERVNLVVCGGRVVQTSDSDFSFTDYVHTQEKWQTEQFSSDVP